LFANSEWFNVCAIFARICFNAVDDADSEIRYQKAPGKDLGFQT